MTDSWDDLSVQTAGLGLQKRISMNVLRPEIFMPPFDHLIKCMKDNPNWEYDTLLDHGVASNTIQTALYAADKLNGLGSAVDWSAQLEKAHERTRTAEILKKMLAKMERGQDVDYIKLIEIGTAMSGSFNDDMVPLSMIEPRVTPFISTGWKPVDKHLGGIPPVGLINVAGHPGVGKTSWLIKFASKFVRKHKKKNVAIFELEMMLGEFAARTLEIDKTITDEEKFRIKVCEKVLTVPEIIARAAKIENLGLIGIDFADLLVSGEVTEPAMAVIYKSLAAAAKQLNVPIILLSQFSRNYQGGIPRPYHIRYTSLAEALSWMIIALYSPTLDYFANEKRKGDPELPIIPGKAYMIAWKCRGGFRVHGGPGAVQLRWDGGLSWANTEGNWFDLTKGHKKSKANEEDDEDWSEYEDD